MYVQRAKHHWRASGFVSRRDAASMMRWRMASICRWNKAASDAFSFRRPVAISMARSRAASWVASEIMLGAPEFSRDFVAMNGAKNLSSELFDDGVDLCIVSAELFDSSACVQHGRVIATTEFPADLRE